MRRLLIPALFALTVSAAGPLGAQSPAPIPAPPPQIVTSAMGEAKVTPDRATIYIGVQTRAATAAAAARENAQRQTAVIDAIRAQGIARELIGTQNYSVFPETRYDNETQTSKVTGYVVSNVVRVEIRRLDLVAPIIDAALSKGANQINSLDFYASNSDEARHSALADAVAKARADAEAIAKAAGGALGGVLELTSSETGPRPVYRMETMAAAKAAGPTPIEPGEQTVQVSITARWRFEPGPGRH